MRQAWRDPALALAVVLVVGSIAMLLAHASPLAGFAALIGGALAGPGEIGETLVQATTLLFPALGIALAFRAGLFNIGAEGQLVLGGMAAGVAGANLNAPPYLAIPLLLALGALGGGAWGALAGVLRARFHANEVISTLMLNVVAVLLAGYLVGGPFKQPGAGAAETALLTLGAYLPLILPNTRLTIAFPIALLVALGLAYVLRNTVFGYELRAVGDAPEAARRAGIGVGSIAVWAMTLSGAIAGMGGATLVMGVLHRFNVGLSPGYGFIAIAVALVGELSPLGITLAAIAFGILQNGALAMQAEAQVPRDVIAVIEGAIVVALAGRRYFTSRTLPGAAL